MSKRDYEDFDEFRHDSFREGDCENCDCDDECVANRECEGCDELLCERCWKEHNAIHFDNLSETHDMCMCDDCIDDALEKEFE